MQVINTQDLWQRWWSRLPKFNLGFKPYLELISKPRTELHFDGKTYMVLRKSKLNLSFAEQAALSQSVDLNTACEVLSQHEKVVISINVAQCFERQSLVPIQVKPKIDAYLKLELTRLTPFTEKDTYSFWHAENSGNHKNLLKVQQIIAKKTLVADLAKAVSAQRAIPIGIMVRKSDNSIFPFVLSMDGRQFGISIANKLWKVLLYSGVAALLSLSCIYIAIAWKQAIENNVIQSEIAAMQSGVKIVQQTLEVMKAKNASMAILQNKENTSRKMTEIIEELSRLLPDDAFISGFSFADNEINLDGQATSPEYLIDLFEKSQAFESVSLTSPVFKLVGEELSRFSMRLTTTPVSDEATD